MNYLLNVITLKNLFEEKLHWTNSKGYLLESDIPSSSVVIARLNIHTLEKKKDMR